MTHFVRPAGFSRHWIWLSALVGVWLLAARPARASADAVPSPDKTLSPYFVVEGADPGVEALPLESTKVDVQVTGVIAEVTVTQAYKNAGKKPINAQYVFPASTRAAVHGMRMLVRDQVIEAVIKEKQQAAKTFEAAKKEGKSASLLEQERPNVFTMKVANVMPGDHLEVSLRYSELLVPTSGVYELDYPTVVGPRYSHEVAANAKPQDKFIASGYTPAGAPPSYSFELAGTLATPIPVQSLESPSHSILTTADNPSLRHFALAASEHAGGNRDFILRYRLAGDAIQSGLSLFDAGSEKFFMLQVEPPKRVPTELIPPREYVFIVDVSGSMSGFPLETAKKLLRELIGGLRPSDKFNVELFSGATALLAEHSLPATPPNIALATRFIDDQKGGGGTELLPALEQAFTLSKSEGLSRSFLVITDGYIGQDRGAIDLVRSKLSDANVFAFGIGSSVNRFLIEGVAKAGAGEPFIVTDPGQAAATAERLRDYVKSPVLTDVKVSYEGFDAYDVEPKSFPDVLAERPVLIQGKYRGDAKGFVNLSGLTGKGGFAQRFDVTQVKPRPEQRALSFLWARSRIATLGDFGFAEPTALAKNEITALGLRYNLLTDYTSFVAVARKVVNPGGVAQNVDQPLPLPAGVSNSAVGPEGDGADEPELWLLAALVGLVLALRAVLPRRSELAQ
ncbi:MAG TPA: VIT and VWA domain-containing protein [Polyangiaceae bacterium]|nr:VIT and VWA domain-containing protein [Polyangiaceae bacterium]